MVRSEVGRRVMVFAGLVCAAVTAAWGQNEPPAATGAGAVDEPRYVRTVETPEAIRLEVSVRRFVHEDPTKPTITLAGAVHVADAAFYEALQAKLDEHDLVLYEGVTPEGVSRIADPASLTDEDRARITKQRIRLVAIMASRHAAERSAPPASLDELVASASRQVVPYLRTALVDAWGNPIAYIPPSAPGGGFDLVSGGADAKLGGEGADADLSFGSQPPLRPEEVEDPAGIQQQLAKGLGLVFQLDAMDHSKPNWRNADMSVDLLAERLGGGEGESDELLGMLSGSSLPAKLAGMLLKLMSMSPMMQTMGKVMIVDVLGMADDISALMPAEASPLMKVIVEDRNEVVMRDLAAVLRDEPDRRTIAIIYGAGHLPGLESAITGDLGYSFESAQWSPAITIAYDEVPVSKDQITMLRSMMKRQLKQAIEMNREREGQAP